MSLWTALTRPGGRSWTFRMTPTRVVLLTLTGLAGGVIVFRLIYGLGAPTNLTDRWPWALWTWMKLTGVALAGAGYSTAYVVHVFGRHRWKPVERIAFLTSLLGYLMVCAALILDLGQWYNAWHPIFFWGYHSVMFELFWCIGGYTVVQLVEFLYIFEERIRMPRFRRVLEKIYSPLLILGVMLPVFHQSALVSLYVIAKGREDTLWWSMLMPLYAVMTSLFVGPSMVVLVAFLCSRTYSFRPPVQILGEMVRLSAFVMLVYVVLRVGDLAVRGVLPRLFDGSRLGVDALIEVGAGGLLPAVLFLVSRVRRSTGGLVATSLLAVLGVALNRFNVVFAGMAHSIGARYWPSWMENAFVVGLTAAATLAFLFVTENFAILPFATREEAEVLRAPAALGTQETRVPAAA